MHTETEFDSIADLESPSNEQTERLLTDKLYRLHNLYHVRDKRGRVVRFVPNDAQITFLTKRKKRNLWLKARQRGITTCAVLSRLDDCLFNSNFEAGIIAHSLDDAEKIFRKAKLAYEMLPSWIKKHRIPNTDKAGEYSFPNNSRFCVDTSFRSGTLSALHVSEMGKIAKKNPEKAKEIVTGAFEAVPIDGEIDVESTAEGMTGEFYELCDRAMKKDHAEIVDLEFAFHFEPWWTSVEYRMDSPVALSRELLEYFEYLKTHHSINLDIEQKYWYAAKYESLQENMHQEYPSYPEEAFMASGRPAFNNQQLHAMAKKARNNEFSLKFFEIRGKEYSVKIFKAPVADAAYSVGADVAEGIEEGDNSTLSIVNKNYDQVASFCGTLEPADHGRLMVAVGKFYNTALLAPEINNHGHATLAAIKEEKYFNIYKRVSTEEDVGKDVVDKFGWLSTSKSKMKYLDDLKEAVRHGETEINDEATLREMMTIVIEEDGNIIMNGKDRTVAHGIALQAIKQSVLPKQFKASIPGQSQSRETLGLDVKSKIDLFKKRARENA